MYYFDVVTVYTGEVCVPTVFVALTEKVYLATFVGVPEKTPVVDDRLTPDGSAPVASLKVGVGVPLVVKVK